MNFLGQHFLKNRATIKKFIGALELARGETIIEIGAGHGELTSELLAFSFELLGDGVGLPIKIIAIEKDRKLIGFLEKRFCGQKHIKVVAGDALKILPQLTKSYNPKAKSYKLVGNIPYYLTGHLLRVVGELEEKPKFCVFTLQKEVAERIVLEPPRMNRLAASVQFWAKPKIIGYVSKREFKPEPKVDSAIIKLTTRDMRHEISNKEYYAAVRMLFAQPRKTILNNISAKGGASKEELAAKLKKIGVDPLARPQNLGIDEITRLAAII